MDPFRLCLALGPLTAYLLLLSALNFSRRPRIVSGARDAAVLGLGVVGLVVVGPVELLLPLLPVQASATLWLVLLGAYLLVLLLAVLLGAPRLIVYNISLDQMRTVLSETAGELDAEARWAGNSVALPRLRVEFYLDDTPTVRNVSLIATSSSQSYAGWRTLEKLLRAKLRDSIDVAPSVWGLGVLVIALVMAVRMGWILYFQPGEVTRGFVEMIHL